jgi:zinc transport system substrate-binding protein
MHARVTRAVRRGVVVAVALALTACQEAPKVAPPRPVVVASFYPLYEFARQVAGDRAEVVSLVPPGAESHDWEPSARDVARVANAAVFVYNGAGFDAGAERLAKQATTKGIVVEATAGLSLLSVDLPGHDAHDHGKKEHARKNEPVRDPHVWLDPTLARAQVDAIKAALARADSAHADHYTAKAAEYSAKLTALHERFAAGLAQCQRREIVVSHAAFAYLAQRYGLRQVPVMGIAPQSEPSPAQLAEVVRLVRRLKARVIFFETLVSSRLAETLAAEVGARTLVLNPVEGLTAEEEKAGKTYLDLMEANLANLRVALDCR